MESNQLFAQFIAQSANRSLNNHSHQQLTLPDLQQQNQSPISNIIFQNIIYHKLTKKTKQLSLIISQLIFIKTHIHQPHSNQIDQQSEIDHDLFTQEQIDFYKSQKLQYKLKVKKQEIPKAVCGKVLTYKDTGFKCLDCEEDPTCIICQECFENSDHRNHRVIPQQGCSGCCDCGDIEAWKPEGSCSKHKGVAQTQAYNQEMVYDHFEQYIVDNFESIFSDLVFYLCQTAELNHPQNPVGDMMINSLESLLEQYNDYIIPLFVKFLMSQFKFPYKLKHNCENYTDREILGTQQECKCTMMELILRYNLKLSKEKQRKFVTILFQLFTYYEFKQFFIMQYTKYFIFLFKPLNKIKSDDAAYSKMLELNVQLFTNEELPIQVCQSKYMSNIPLALCKFYKELKENNDNLKRLGIQMVYDIDQIIRFILDRRQPTRMILNNFEFMQTYIKQFRYINKVIHLKILNSHILSYNSDYLNIFEYENMFIKSFTKMLNCIIRDDQIDKKIIDTMVQQIIAELDLEYSLKQQKRYFMSNILVKVLIMSLVARHSKMEDLLALDLKLFFSQYVKDSQQFINNLAKDVVQMIGLIKQIQSKQWIYYGESFLGITSIYKHAKFLFFDCDFAFLSILLNYVEHQKIEEIMEGFFFKDKTYKYFQKGQLYRAEENKLKNFTEKDEREIDCFIEILNYLPYSYTCFANLYQVISPESNQNLIDKIQNKLLQNILYLRKNMDFITIKQNMIPVLISNKNLENQLLQISNLDQNKKFKLKQELDNQNCWNYQLFYRDKKTQSELFELIQKKVTDKSFDFIICDDYIDSKAVQEFQFRVENVISQIFNDQVILLANKYLKDQKIAIETSMSLITLVYNIFRYKGKEVYQSNKELIQQNQIFDNFVAFNIKGTCDKFKKLQHLLEDIDENKQGAEDIQISQQLFREKQIEVKKAQMKQKQMLIMQKFKTKNENFIKSNKDYDEIEIEQPDMNENDEHCVICLSKLETLQDCVFFGYFSIKNVVSKQYNHFSSCIHYCHSKCYDKFIKNGQNTLCCPKCNRVFNISVPILVSQNSLNHYSQSADNPSLMNLQSIDKQLNEIQISDKMQIEIDGRVNDFYNEILQLTIQSKYNTKNPIDENYILEVVEDFIENELKCIDSNPHKHHDQFRIIANNIVFSFKLYQSQFESTSKPTYYYKKYQQLMQDIERMNMQESIEKFIQYYDSVIIQLMLYFEFDLNIFIRQYLLIIILKLFMEFNSIESVDELVDLELMVQKVRLDCGNAQNILELLYRNYVLMSISYNKKIEQNQSMTVQYLLKKTVDLVEITGSDFEEFKNQNKEALKEIIENNKKMVEQGDNQPINQLDQQVLRLEDNKYVKKYIDRFVGLSDNLLEFHMKYQRASCELCQSIQLSSNVVLCLVCNKVLCAKKCQQENSQTGNLSRHTQESHLGNSMFIYLISGEVLVMCNFAIRYYDSIYVDKYGVSFGLKDNKKQDWKLYQLDQARLNKYLCYIIHNQVNQNIYYQAIQDGYRYQNGVL